MSVKSHRQLRHEIEQNELADWLGERLEALKPHATAITLGLVLILAIVLGSIYYFGSEGSASSAQWAEYFAAFNDREPEVALEKLLSEQPGTVVGLWAAQSLGDMNLARGSGLMFSDREKAKEHLDKAEAYFKRVESGTQDTMLVSRARLGLGKVYESLARPKEALKYYEMVAQAQKDTAIGKAADRAAARMRDSRNVELLAWFAKEEPKKPAGMPGPGRIPGMPDDLPDQPDISFPGSDASGLGSPGPGVPGLGLDGIGTGTPEAPEPGLPQPGAALPDSTPPEATPPAEPKGETPPPAAETPAPEPADADAKPPASPEATPPAPASPADQPE